MSRTRLYINSEVVILAKAGIRLRKTGLGVKRLVILISMLITMVFLILGFLSPPVFGGHHEACGNASPAFEEELLKEINQYRVKNGLVPLSEHETLQLLAKGHSRHMCERARLDHDNFLERYRRSGRMLCIENVGWGYATAVGQFKSWKESTDHNKNMVNGKIRFAGIFKAGEYVTFFACD